MDRVRFYFDPRCPWCFQASRWVRRLAELGEVELSWGLYCLELANLPADGDVAGLGVTARSATALRTAAAIGRAGGNADIGRFYRALGKRVWETSDPASDRDEAVRESAEETGHPRSTLDDAMADPTTWDEVVAQHRALVDEKGGIGVPTLVLDGGDGPAIFGPVMSHLPDDEEAVRVWHHVRWLARQDNFYELKTNRPFQPDVPGWKVPVGKLTFGSRPWMPSMDPNHIPTDGRTPPKPAAETPSGDVDQPSGAAGRPSPPNNHAVPTQRGS